MMASATQEHAKSAARNEHRHASATPLNLIEVQRITVVDTIMGSADESDGVFSAGPMRELCPHCRTNHLKLILRQKRVRQSHLFCEVCDKCFDARHLDGTSALEMD